MLTALFLCLELFAFGIVGNNTASSSSKSKEKVAPKARKASQVYRYSDYFRYYYCLCLHLCDV